tara:strand:- start:6930 stop:7211 length:282 start_codon:yes stop_codon:yes gene_type:complete
MPIYNGVGAWWMSSWMRGLLTKWFLLDFDEGAAEDHDLAYWLGELPRSTIDRLFLTSMLGQSVTVRQRCKALVVYIMVRLIGWTAYSHRPSAL